MRKKRECKLIMLPTDSLGTIMSDVGPYDTDMVLISELPENLRGHERPHNELYVVIESDIEDGDWVYLEQAKAVRQAFLDDGRLMVDNLGGKPESNYYKVVASTRHKLLLPELPKEFLEEYVEHPVDKIMVEFETSEDGQMVDKYSHPSFFDLVATTKNQIHISHVKESYSKVEVIKLLGKLLADSNDPRYTIQKEGGMLTMQQMFPLNKWIEENL